MTSLHLWLTGSIAIEIKRNSNLSLSHRVLNDSPFRYNLDPFGNHDDGRLWSALERAYMKDKVGRAKMCGKSVG